MYANVFVDTNIWLYALVRQIDGDPRHQQAADFLLQLTRPVISSQVLRETCSNLIKKAHVSEETLCVLIGGWYQDCEIIVSNKTQHLLASKLRQSYSLSYWDSLIIAAALDGGCTTLFSEDMQHGQQIEGGLTIANPFIACNP
jgi:predicted nucleic acid-binding protein